jgi:hypothetical protein
VADAPTAARLARLTGGRPGLAVTYASAPEAIAIRGEIARLLLDLVDLGAAERLRASRDLMTRGAALAALLAPTRDDGPGGSRRGRRGATGDELTEVPGPGDRGPHTPSAELGEPDAGSARKASASDRRRALGLVLDIWLDTARDLAVAGRGASGSIRDMALLEELVAVAPRLSPGAVDAALARLARARELVDANVSPELVLDVALLRWPRATRAA